jgi:hypothetical protein
MHCASIVNMYVKYRGGLQEIRVFEIGAGSFDPDAIEEKSFVHNFRFSHSEMDRLILQLASAGVPSVIKTRSRDKCSLYEAVAMLCMKFAWPTRLGSMVKIFRSSTSRMSRIVGELRRTLFNMFGEGLRSPRILSLDELDHFALAISGKSGCDSIFAFVDGTVRPMCKPSYLQGPVYNGKDRVHALKYQGVVTPDGMLLQLAGPWPGSRHDQHMLNTSHLKQYVHALPRRADERMFEIYADQGYAQSPGICTPFFDGAINPAHEIYNQSMASSRIAVEWAFGDIVNHWASLDLKRQQQLLTGRKIGQVYLVAGLMSNFYNCFHRNRGSQYFDVSPPTLEAYVNMLKVPAARIQNA